MDETWNSWEIKPPPVTTQKMLLHYDEMNKLKEILCQIQKTLTDIRYFHKEAAMLSRFLYKNKRIFRHDKGLQNLVKINQCLKRYLKLDLNGVINNYRLSIPRKLVKEASHAYLPTRQMLKWVLLRIQAFSQIFLRIFELSKETGSYIYQKLMLGWSLYLTLFMYSLLARIFVCSKFLLTKSIEWYNSLHRFLPYFEKTAEFLPDYEFPTNLKKWIGEIDLSAPKTPFDKVFEFIDLVNNDEDDVEDEDIKIVHEVFLKSLFSESNIKIESSKNDTEVVENKVKKEKEDKDKTGAKRPIAISQSEDLGVLVDNEDEEIQEIPVKKFKSNNEKKNKKKFWKQRKMKFEKFKDKTK